MARIMYYALLMHGFPIRYLVQLNLNQGGSLMREFNPVISAKTAAEIPFVFQLKLPTETYHTQVDSQMFIQKPAELN